MPYAEAIAKYGSDKPDLRCGMQIQDLRELFRESSFRVFKEIVAGGGTVRGFVDQERRRLLAQRGGRHRRPGEAARRRRPDLGAARRRRRDHQLDHEGAGRGRGRARCSTRRRRGNGDILLVAAGEAGCHVETARPAAAVAREAEGAAQPG